jgi:hypothetical protein
MLTGPGANVWLVAVQPVERWASVASDWYPAMVMVAFAGRRQHE